MFLSFKSQFKIIKFKISTIGMEFTKTWNPQNMEDSTTKL